MANITDMFVLFLVVLMLVFINLNRFFLQIHTFTALLLNMHVKLELLSTLMNSKSLCTNNFDRKLNKLC